MCRNCENSMPADNLDSLLSPESTQEITPIEDNPIPSRQRKVRHRKKRFLVALRGKEGAGNIIRTCQAVKISVSAHYRWRRVDEEFAEAFRKAKSQGDRVQKALLEAKLDEVALNPEKKVCQPAILASFARLKRLDPEYRENPQINIQSNTLIQLPSALEGAIASLLQLPAAERRTELLRQVAAVPGIEPGEERLKLPGKVTVSDG